MSCGGIEHSTIIACIADIGEACSKKAVKCFQKRSSIDLPCCLLTEAMLHPLHKIVLIMVLMTMNPPCFVVQSP